MGNTTQIIPTNIINIPIPRFFYINCWCRINIAAQIQPFHTAPGIQFVLPAKVIAASIKRYLPA
jgi:hypothetical protein